MPTQVQVSTSKITDADWIVKDLKTRAVQIVLLIHPIDNEDFFTKVSTLKRSLVIQPIKRLESKPTFPLLVVIPNPVIPNSSRQGGGLTIEEIC